MTVESVGSVYSEIKIFFVERNLRLISYIYKIINSVNTEIFIICIHPPLFFFYIIYCGFVNLRVTSILRKCHAIQCYISDV